MYTTETISELCDIEVLPEGTFPISFNFVYRYHREELFLSEKRKYAEYSKGYFCRVQSTINLITYKYKIVIPQKLQKYVVKWYHMYLLHPVLDRT